MTPLRGADRRVGRRVDKRPVAGVATACIALAVLAGCASPPRVDAQWSDPKRPEHPLRAASVLAVCEAGDEVTARLCGDQLRDDLTARGVRVVSVPDGAAPPPGTPASNGATGDLRHVELARALSASAVWVATVRPAAVTAEPAQGAVSFGFGSFGFGRGGGGGVGLGIGLPVGADGGVRTAYGADARVLDATSGRLMWTAKAASPGNGGEQAQIGQLIRNLVSVGGDSGLF